MNKFEIDPDAQFLWVLILLIIASFVLVVFAVWYGMGGSR